MNEKLEVLRQWALSLIIASAAGTFAMVLLPRGSMDKTVRAVVGIFVVAVICSPLAQMKDINFSVQAFAEYELETENVEALRKQLISACRNAVENQITDTARELGIEVESVEAEMNIDAENCIIIHKITVNITAENGEKTKEFSEILQKKLGVPVQVNSF